VKFYSQVILDSTAKVWLKEKPEQEMTRIDSGGTEEKLAPYDRKRSRY